MLRINVLHIKYQHQEYAVLLLTLHNAVARYLTNKMIQVVRKVNNRLVVYNVSVVKLRYKIKLERFIVHNGIGCYETS